MKQGDLVKHKDSHHKGRVFLVLEIKQFVSFTRQHKETQLCLLEVSQGHKTWDFQRNYEVISESR